MAKNESYEEFVNKFKPKLTTDDCYTPKAVHAAVVKYVDRKVFKLEGHKVLRPFYPGGDYENEEYTKDCIVLDNPPFSKLAKIVDFYTKRNIKFWLYAPHLTLFTILCRPEVTAVVAGAKIIFENGANVSISFITNVWPKDEIFATAPLLQRYIKIASKQESKKRRVIKYPPHVVSSALLGKIVDHGVEFSCPRNEAVFIRGLDSGAKIYGSGVLMSERMAAERMAAERMAVERMAVERMAAERIAAETNELSEREKEIVKRLGK